MLLLLCLWHPHIRSEWWFPFLRIFSGTYLSINTNLTIFLLITLDIFAAWMAQWLKTHLLTETWQRKRQELPSNCSLPYHVYNIKAIKISRQSYFSSHLDHAKWCISQKGTKNRWTCIGDLNRSPYQAFRSGGFICTQNQLIYQAFQGLVLYYEKCNWTWWKNMYYCFEHWQCLLPLDPFFIY